MTFSFLGGGAMAMKLLTCLQLVWTSHSERKQFQRVCGSVELQSLVRSLTTHYFWKPGAMAIKVLIVKVIKVF